MRDTADPSAPAPVRVTAEHRELLDQVLDRWSLHVLDRLCEHPHRFNELRRALPGITQKSLATTLRRLESNGMVDRVVLDTRPPGVEYRLTDLGATLQDLIDALFGWTLRNMDAVRSARARYEDALDG